MSSTPTGGSPYPPPGPPPVSGPYPAPAPSPILGPAPTVAAPAAAAPSHKAQGAPPGLPAPGRTAAPRPPVVTLAVLLMVPAVVVWLVAGIAFFLAMLRTEGTGIGRLLVVGIGGAVLALALLVVFLASLGMMMAWQGDGAAGLTVPAGFTFGIFVVVIVTLLSQGKLTFQPTMVTPLVVGGLAGVSLALVCSPPARAWFARRRS
ncbi:hypothetical protein [Verrucosispora sp. TAA-831]|uniref:hypothetical protein n=1 Tax=Verrucosispora sp. TAA-831 TaxID=3422227 RepID=UPI003D6EE278